MPTVETTAAGGESHLMALLWGSDPVVKLVLLILLSMSVACWAIILFKYREIGRQTNLSSRFYTAFTKVTRLDELWNRKAVDSALNTIFRRGVGIVAKREGSAVPATQAGLNLQLRHATRDEIRKLERYLPFLATTASAAPFIGLFGTVWGILAAFWQIGQAGSSSLAVVGPFIAEALIATAVGLAAAIPALVFYNHFSNKVRLLSEDLENFSEDLSARIAREFSLH